MPKLKPSDDEIKNRTIRAYISKNIDLYGLSEEEIAVRMHIAKRTLQNKRKRPETFTLGELRKLCVILKFTNDEKAAVL